MSEDNNQKFIEFVKKILRKIKPRFSFHYVAYTTLITLVIFSVVQLVGAATPNPGHPWSELGNGLFAVTENQSVVRTYTFPDANATILTTNAAVTVAQGGTNLTSIADKTLLVTTGANTLSSLTIPAGQSVRRNATDTAFEAYTPGVGMTWPAGGAGIPNYSGSSSWGTSYTTTGSGTVVALATSPVFITPSLGVATATSINSLSLSQDNTDLNVKVGSNAGINIVSGATHNTFVGYDAGRSGSGTSTNAADFNTAIGYRSLYSNTTGYSDTAIGYQSLYLNTDGRQNTAIGDQALYSNTTGGNNIAIGFTSGRYIADGTTANTTSDFSVYLGTGTKSGADNNQNEIVIGYNAVGNGSNTATIGNTSLLRTYLTGVNLKAGTATAGTAPLKFTSGTNLTTAEAGAMEWDGTNLFVTQTSGPTRRTIAYTSDLTTGYVPYTGATANLNLGTHSLISPTILGGSSTTQDLNLQTTSGAGTTGADMHFLVGNNGATEAMTILNNGNVGIGETSPDYAFNVKGIASFGDVSTDSVLLGYDMWGGERGLVIEDTTEPIAIEVGGMFGYGGGSPLDPKLAVIGSTGNVGLSTPSPTNLLSLSGTAARTIWMERNTTAATAGQGLTLSSGGAIAGTANLAGGDLNLKSGISTGTGSSSLRFFTATGGTSAITDRTPTEKMTILGSGNVGIGVDTPSSLLHISGPTPIFIINSSNADDVERISFQEEDSEMLYISANYAGAGVRMWSAIDQNMAFGTNNTERITIQGDGHVGINDTSPDGILDIDSNITTGVELGITNTGVYTGTGLFSVVANSATTGTVGLITANGLTSGSILSLTSNGTGALLNPKGLNIALSGTNAISGRTTYGAYISNTHAGSTSTNVGLYATATGGTTANYAAIFQNGNVGIGTTAPTSPLHVSGSGWVSRFDLSDFSRDGLILGNGNVYSGDEAGLYEQGGTYPMVVYDADTDYVYYGPISVNTNSNNVGISLPYLSAPAARLHLPAGNSSAGTAPLKLTSGTNLGTTEAGAIEFNGTHLYFTATNGGTRYQLDQQGGGGNWDTIGDPSGNGAIAFGSTVQTMDWASATTTNPLTLNAPALTTGNLFSVNSNSLTSGNLIDITSNGTGALTNQRGLNIALSGTNGTAAQTTYGAYISNTHAGTTSTNVGLYASATGGTTANYAAIFQNGNVGIGTTTPNNLIQVSGLINFDTTDFNTSIGRETGAYLVTGAQYNTFLGHQAGRSGTSGGTNAADNNTAIGYRAMYANTTGASNTAIGNYALTANTTGNSNSAIGTRALFSNTEGYNNTANGMYALYSNLTGDYNNANGQYSLYENTTGNYNTAFGNYSLNANRAGSNATAFGYDALRYSNSTTTPYTNYNIGIGYQALMGTTTAANNIGNYNTAIGYQSSYGYETADRNTTIGYFSGRNNVSGDNNILIGHQAGESLSSGSNNIALGYDVELPSDTASNQMTIGNLIFATGGFGTGTTIGTGNVGIGLNNPTARLHLPAGTATAGTAPLKLTSGTALSAIEDGALEYHSSHLYFSIGSTRYQLDQQGGGGGNWDTIGDPSGNGAIAFGSTVQTMDWASATTTNPLTLNAPALTTGNLFSVNSNSLTSGSLLYVTSSGTGALTNQSGLKISLEGVNGTSGQTTYGAYITNGHGGTTSTSIGLYASASHGTTNYAAMFEGDVVLNSQSDLRFADADSSNWVAFESASTVSSNVTWKLPSADAEGCFKSDGSGVMSIEACGDTNTQTFASNGNYTIPSNALLVIVEAWGGGGGGGGGYGAAVGTIRSGGAGGGGGAYVQTTIAAASLGSPGGTVPVTVGAAGTAGSSTSGVSQDGGAGGRSCISTTTNCAGTVYVSVYGGGGGNGGSGAAGSGAGGGGGSHTVGTTNGTQATGGTGGAPLGAGAGLANSGAGGGGGATAAASGAQGGAAYFGGAGGGSSSSTGAGNSGAGGGSYKGGSAGGAGGSIATTYTRRLGGNGGSSMLPATGGGAAGGATDGASGSAGANGIVGGGFGGGGGTTGSAVAGGAGGAGGARGGGGGGGGASNTTTGSAGGAGGAGYVRAWTLRGAGADLAEIYGTVDESIEAGDVVSLDPTMRAGVKKTEKAYDVNTIGVISTKPGLVIGDLEDEATPTMVALSGRVPVKVNLENGPIKKGDYLTSSSVPGVAMKATKAGTIIGQAMTEYLDEENPGYVVAFIKSGPSNGIKLNQIIPGLELDSTPEVGVEGEVPSTEEGEESGEEESETIDPNETIQKVALTYFLANKIQLEQSADISEMYTDRLSAALEIITPTIITDTLSTNSIVISTGEVISFNSEAYFEVPPLFNSDTAGFAIIKEGQRSVDIIFDESYIGEPVVNASMAFSIVDDINLASIGNLFNDDIKNLIVNSSENGFTILINKDAPRDLRFSWTALSVKDPKIFESVIDGLIFDEVETDNPPDDTDENQSVGGDDDTNNSDTVGDINDELDNEGDANGEVVIIEEVTDDEIIEEVISDDIIVTEEIDEEIVDDIETDEVIEEEAEESFDPTSSGSTEVVPSDSPDETENN